MPEVQGRTVTFPVEVRRATAWSAQFLVPRSSAQSLLPPPLRAFGVAGRAIVALAVQRYEDCDLGAYDEVALSILVRRLDGGREPAVYIRQLPVNRGFTLEAGRTIWGYPKWLADIDIAETTSGMRCVLREEERTSAEIEIRHGGLFRMRERAVPTYSDAEGTLNFTPWEMHGGTRARLGGGSVRPGAGRFADDLRALGFPRRSVLSTTSRDLRASFGPSQQVR